MLNENLEIKMKCSSDRKKSDKNIGIFLVSITVLIDVCIRMRVCTFYYLSNDEYSKLMLDDLQALLTSNAKVETKKKFSKNVKICFHG